MMVMAFEDQGWFFLNGRLIAELDLSRNQSSGQICLMGGFFIDSRGSVGFEEYSVWSP